MKIYVDSKAVILGAVIIAATYWKAKQGKKVYYYAYNDYSNCRCEEDKEEKKENEGK